MDYETAPELNMYSRLGKFSEILNYELSTGFLFFLSYFQLVAVLLMIIAAVIFTPYMLYV